MSTYQKTFENAQKANNELTAFTQRAVQIAAETGLSGARALYLAGMPDTAEELLDKEVEKIVKEREKLLKLKIKASQYRAMAEHSIEVSRMIEQASRAKAAHDAREAAFTVPPVTTDNPEDTITAS